MKIDGIIKKQTDFMEYPIHTVWLIADEAGFILDDEKLYYSKEKAEKRVKYLNSSKFIGKARVHAKECYLITDLKKLKRKLNGRKSN